MQPLVTIEGGNETQCTPLQTKFNQLIRQIERLQNQYDRIKEKYDKALLAYQFKLRPLELKSSDIISRFLKQVISLARPKRALNRQERKVLDKILDDSFRVLFSFVGEEQVEDSLISYYNDHYRARHTQEFEDEMLAYQEMLQDEFGLDDLNFSGCSSPNGDRRELMQKLMESFIASMDQKTPNRKPNPQSKREQAKQQKIMELDKLKQRGIQTIYKRLVKQLHPDRETDPSERGRKETLMKQITVAYDKRDLLTLLQIECQESSEPFSMGGDEILKSYNSLLVDQAKHLKFQIGSICTEPQYREIAHYVGDEINHPMRGINRWKSDTQTIADEYSKRLDTLSSPSPLASLKEALSAACTTPGDILGQLMLEILTQNQHYS